jgi:replicative DNA helicase
MQSLPHDRVAEAALLSACLTRGMEAVAEVHELVRHRDAFYVPAHGDIFDAIGAAADAGEPIDTVTIGHEMHARGTFGASTAQLLSVLASHREINTSAHARIVADLASRRALVLALDKARDAAMAEDAELPSVIAQARAAIDRVDAPSAGQLVTIRVAVEETRELMRRSEAGEVVLTETGFGSVDKHMGGGAADGDLVVLGGRPSMGKTAFGLSVVRNCVLHREHASGRYKPREEPTPALVISVEMGLPKLVLRWLSDITGIDGRALRAPTKEWFGSHFSGQQTNRRAVDSGMDMLAAMEITLTRPTEVRDMDTVQARARSWRAAMRKKYGPKVKGLVLIDFLQLIEPPAKLPKNARSDEIEGAKAKAAKAMAVDLGCPVIALAQLNRKVDERPENQKRPRMSDLEGSGKIEQVADAIGFLYRPWVYDAKLADLEREFQDLRNRRNRREHFDATRFNELVGRRGYAELGLAKVRDGAAHAWAPLEFTPELTRFLDLRDADGLYAG